MALDDERPYEGAKLTAVDVSSGREARIKDMHAIITKDRPDYDFLNDYLEGRHTMPFVPTGTRKEVTELRRRSVVNLIPLLTGIPAQISFVDGYHRSGQLFPKEWEAWRRNKMNAKQTLVYKTALTYGAAYVAVEELGHGKPKMNLLSTRDTVALFHDPVNDEHPVYVLTIKSYPLNEKTPGRAVYYDAERIVHLDYGKDREFSLATDADGAEMNYPHDLGVCPVVRYVTTLDDEGKVRGVIEPMIPLQDSVNQSKFDMLTVQSSSSWKVRWASGMHGEPIFNEDGTPRVDEDGNQVFRPIEITPSTWLATDDPAARFGTLDETPLDGFISALEMCIKQFAVVGQLPPHSLLGNMSNLSAETLVAAMSQTMRFGHTLHTSWNDSNVLLLRLAGMDMGVEGIEDDYSGECRWRDMSDTTMAAIVDALGKAVTMLGVPPRSTWSRIPGYTYADIEQMEKQSDELADSAKFEADTPQAAAARERTAPRVTPTPQAAGTPLPLPGEGNAAG